MIPDNEPMFVIRGQDIIAREVVLFYAKTIRPHNPELADECEAWAEVMDQWHFKKVPD